MIISSWSLKSILFPLHRCHCVKQVSNAQLYLLSVAWLYPIRIVTKQSSHLLRSNKVSELHLPPLDEGPWQTTSFYRYLVQMFTMWHHVWLDVTPIQDFDWINEFRCSAFVFFNFPYYFWALKSPLWFSSIPPSSKPRSVCKILF